MRTPGVTPNCDRLLGLHQDITIIYVVDGYSATFNTEDARTVMEGRGLSVIEALRDLEEQLAKVVKIDKYNFTTTKELF